MSTRSANENSRLSVSFAVAAVLCAGNLTGRTESSESEAITPVNSAPTFDTDPSVSVSENTTSVATAAASDVDGDLLTYAISGGSDSWLFEIDPSSGTITFLEPFHLNLSSPKIPKMTKSAISMRQRRMAMVAPIRLLFPSL